MTFIDRLRGKWKDQATAEGPLSEAVAEVPEDEAKLAQRIKKLYQAGVAYKRERGFYDDWPEYERFWNADQWPEPTNETKTFPRPVTNIFTEIIEQKVAALTYEAPEIYFEPMEGNPEPGAEAGGVDESDTEAAKLLTQMAKHQSHKLEIEELLEALARDAALLGTGILMFPWDNSIVGGSRWQYVGDIAGYVIDPADFFPDDPTNYDLQDQPGIILAERRPLDEVREFYREYAPEVVDALKGEKVSAESQVYDHQHIEPSETKYVDVLHRWWKDDGEDGRRVVWYAVVCQGYLLRKPEMLYRHGLYPFVAFRWYPQRKSFFGKSESADIINNQKEINRLDGIMLLAAYYHGLPQKRYKEGAVDEREITALNPGQAIKDTSPGTGWGVDYLDPPQMPAYPAQMRDRLDASTKSSAGVHESWTGKAPSSDLNASAIIALQEAAGVRIRGIQRRFFRAIRDMARLWLAHWKTFVEETRLVRIVGDDNAVGFAWFRGIDYADMEFDVLVKAGPASPYSKSLQMAQLDKMLEAQLIDGDEYLELIPADVFPQAHKVLEKRQEAKKDAWRLEVMANVITSLAAQMGVAPEQVAQAAGIPPEVLQMAEQMKAEQGGGAPSPPEQLMG